MAETTQTITPPATITPEEKTSADLFFSEHKPAPSTPPEPVVPGASDAGTEVKPPAGEQPPVGTESKPGEEGEDQSKWFIPGKYKTQGEAIKNQENRMGGIAQQLDQIGKKLDQIGKPAKEEPVVTATGELNPETGKPYSQQEIMAQWDAYFLEKPTEARIAWDKMVAEQQSKGLTDNITKNVIRNMTWAAFLSSNNDMNNPEKIQELQTILQQIPFLANKPDALMQAKAISLASGETLEEKYQSYLLSEKGKPATQPPAAPAPQLPGQQAVNKGGGGKDSKPDPFFSTKDGKGIKDYRG